MKVFYRLITSLALACCLGFAACKKATAPPPAPLALEEIPGAVEKEFKQAKASIKTLAFDAVADVKAKEFTKAAGRFQGLCSLPDLSDSQRSVATRSLMTINENIRQAAVNTGDPEAVKTIQNQILFK